jgi:glutamate racemase
MTMSTNAITTGPIATSMTAQRLEIQRLIHEAAHKADRLSEAADEIIRAVHAKRQEAKDLHEAMEALDLIATKAERTRADQAIYDRMMNRLLDQQIQPDDAWLGLSW